MGRSTKKAQQPQAKFMLLPSPNREWIVGQLRDAASSAGLEVFEIPEPGSRLGEMRLGVANGGVFDPAHPCPLLFSWPEPRTLIELMGVTTNEQARQVTRDASELFVYANEVGATMLVDTAEWSGSVTFDLWLAINQPPQTSSPIRLRRDPTTAAARAAIEAMDVYILLPEPHFKANWDPRLFTSAPTSDFSMEGDNKIDLTGPPRKLAQGPFLFLNPGEWEIRACFSIYNLRTPHQFRFDWGPPGIFSTFKRVISRSGHYEVVLSTVWEWGAAAELIIEILESSLEGTFEFLGATVERVAEPVQPPENSVKIATVSRVIK